MLASIGEWVESGMSCWSLWMGGWVGGWTYRFKAPSLALISFLIDWMEEERAARFSIGGWVGGWVDVPFQGAFFSADLLLNRLDGGGKSRSFFLEGEELFLFGKEGLGFLNGGTGGGGDDLWRRWVGGWVGGWVEEDEAVGMGYCEPGVGG